MHRTYCSFLVPFRGKRIGFTVFEIMVAVAVIGLLAVLTLPAYRMARMELHRIQCRNNQRLLRDAIDQWAMENNKVDGDSTLNFDMVKYVECPDELVCPACGLKVEIPEKLGIPISCPGQKASHVIPME